MERFVAHQDIYDEFKLWLYNIKNRMQFHEDKSYDNFALGFDFSCDEAVTEHDLTAQDISVKFGYSDKINLDAVAVCNLLIYLREDADLHLVLLKMKLSQV